MGMQAKGEVPAKYPELALQVVVITGAGSGIGRTCALPLAQAEEVANAVCFLLSEQASYINGAALSVDGGVSARTTSPRF